jgi:hypothetical protein
MAKRSAKQASDPNDLEIHATVAGFEVALRKADSEGGKQYFEIVLRSTDRTSIMSLLLTDSRRRAASRIMDFHAGCCAMQHIVGTKLERRAA